MTGRPASPDDQPAEFRHVGGEPSLDFANTAEWDGDEFLVDLLSDYESLVRWAESAQVIEAPTARKLRSRSRRNREESEHAMARARTLRRILHTVFHASAIAHGRARAGNALDKSVAALDVLLREALKHRRIITEHGRVQLNWNGMGDRLDCIEWPLIWNAAQLLASDAAASVRMCGRQDCGWVYVDRSRNGLRRWCSMDTCGSREKAHRHYARVKMRQQARPGI